MVPFPKYPSISRLAEDPPTSADNADDEEMEWREVEVEMRLNTDGKIMEPGEEMDTKEEPDDDDDNNSNVGGPSTTAPEPSQGFSRITNPLPPTSTITIYGVKNSSTSQDQNNTGEGASGQGAGGGDPSRVGGSGLHPARARSPHKRFLKSRGKKAQNDWWTTTTKVVEQRPKQPVMGLLDVHTGQPHVRQDTQSTAAIWETADDLEEWTRCNKRQKLTGSQPDPQTDHDPSVLTARTIMNGPGLSSVNDTILIETIFDDELRPSKYELLPGMWDFRSMEP
jgi:hypothetical protein